MIEGIFRDDWPMVSLTVVGETGKRVINFIVDTGFGGSLAMPHNLLQQIGAEYAGNDEYQLADGTLRRFGFFLVEIAEDEDNRAFRVLVHIEITEGGTVFAEPL